MLQVFLHSTAYLHIVYANIHTYIHTRKVGRLASFRAWCFSAIFCMYVCMDYDKRMYTYVMMAMNDDEYGDDYGYDGLDGCLAFWTVEAGLVRTYLILL